MLVHGGPRDGDYYTAGGEGRDRQHAEAARAATVILGKWVEPYGNGESIRKIETTYAALPG